jgi:hypothetical protein
MTAARLARSDNAANQQKAASSDKRLRRPERRFRLRGQWAGGDNAVMWHRGPSVGFCRSEGCNKEKTKMKALSVAGALAVAMTFGTTMALAQSSPQLGDGTNSPAISKATPGYNVGTSAAQLGDGSNFKPIPKTTPGYGLGNGAAQLGDGSNFKPIPKTTPGYSLGNGSAQLGDGSNTPGLSTTTPGYSVGTGSAQKSDAQNSK